jgi:hypothetical protein
MIVIFFSHFSMDDHHFFHIFLGTIAMFFPSSYGLPLFAHLPMDDCHFFLHLPMDDHHFKKKSSYG